MYQAHKAESSPCEEGPLVLAHAWRLARPPAGLSDDANIAKKKEHVARVKRSWARHKVNGDARSTISMRQGGVCAGGAALGELGMALGWCWAAHVGGGVSALKCVCCVRVAARATH